MVAEKHNIHNKNTALAREVARTAFFGAVGRQFGEARTTAIVQRRSDASVWNNDLYYHIGLKRQENGSIRHFGTLTFEVSLPQ